MADLNALHQLSSQQLGLFTTRQARDLGFDYRWVGRRERAAEVRRLTPTVLAFEAAPRSERQRAMAAILHAGGQAGLTARTAAAMWGARGFQVEPIHVLLERKDRWRYGRDRVTVDGVPIIVHTSRVLPESHLVTLERIPIVTPTRLVFELAALLHAGRLERALDDLWRSRLTTGPLLFEMLGELDVFGRRNMNVLRSLLDARGVDYVPTDSNLEARFHELMRKNGLGPFTRQVDIVDGTARLARADFAHDHKQAVVEVNGDTYHTALVDQRADQARRQRLEQMGVVVIDVSEYEVWHNPAPALERVRRGLLRAQPRAHRAA